jgi:hypothetical protein
MGAHRRCAPWRGFTAFCKKNLVSQAMLVLLAPKDSHMSAGRFHHPIEAVMLELGRDLFVVRATGRWQHPSTTE